MGVEANLQSQVVEPNDLSLRAWMSLVSEDIGGYGWISKDDLDQRFALSHYTRMHEVERVGDEELQLRFVEDALAYIEENVMRVKLGHKEFELRDGDMYTPGFGKKSILTMCRDTVVARQEKGIDAERAKHEGLGFANLVKLLEVMSPGDVAVLVSPPDMNDKNMSDYSMAYIYEKGDNGNVWFGAVRDEHRTISDWQDFAKENSLWQTDWKEYDHLKFVALPFVAKEGLGQILKRLGVGYVAEVPEWMKRETEISAQLIVANIASGNRVMAQRVLDSFKMAVIAGRNLTSTEDGGYRVKEMVWDPIYWNVVRGDFWSNDGGSVVEAGGVCGSDAINGIGGRFAKPLPSFRKDNNLTSSLMGVDEDNVLSTRTDSKPEGTIRELNHVGCPLCGSCDVTAYITSTHIHCSKCKKSKRLN